MTVGYAAKQEWIINEEYLDELELESWETFKKLLERIEIRNILTTYFCAKIDGLPEDKFVNSYVNDFSNAELLTNIYKTYKQLISDIELKTDLIVSIDYHDSENKGSPRDDISGVFFVIDEPDDIVKYTSLGEQLMSENAISLVRWVTLD